ncbi:substrate-binding domain-containing protein [Pendulispora albinea]|uniref:Substrate-binding domain-containing protein n=1 Tax=Pendulispora albinea TaxID=2741071 RepID=A0ABZ2LQ95_9BACT
MKTIAKSILTAIVATSVAACGASSAVDENAQTGSAAEALTGPNGQGFFGSDTMRDAIVSAVAASPAAGSLTYLGTGSGNGEKCLRGKPVGIYCNGSKDQSITPMSRDLKGCEAGEKSHRVALDGIGIWSSSGQSVTDISLANVRNAFCGTDGSGSTAACSVTNWSQIGGANATIVAYRRDDASGTTDTFKSILGEKGAACNAFCGSVKVVVERASGPALSTDPDGTSSLQAPNGPCAPTDSATDCIGKLSAGSSNVLAYAGLGAGTVSPAPKAIKVAGKEPSLANIRALVSDPANAYPFARFLYLNENTANSRALAETKFFKWAFGQAPYGSDATALTFESKLTDAGFISCTDQSDPDHVALECGAGACN